MEPREPHAELGQTRTVKPTDWRTTPLPAAHVTIRADRLFTQEQMARIRHGFLPEGMEDKWFIYWQDDRLHLHRSWTGYGIFVARFEAEPGGGGRLVEVLASRDPEEYKGTDPEEDLRSIFRLIADNFLDEEDRDSVNDRS